MPYIVVDNLMNIVDSYIFNEKSQNKIKHA